jgi:two-component system OmpR family sensor kinase
VSRLRALRRRLAVRTLRGRLIAGLLLLLAVSCVAVGVTTVLALQGFLTDRLDQQLVADHGRFAATLEHHQVAGEPDSDDMPAAGFGDTRGQAPGTFGARLVNGAVTHAVVIRDRFDDPVRLSPADRATLARLPLDGHGHGLHLSDLDDYRAVAMHGADGDVLITGLPTHGVEETVRRLAMVEMVVFGAVLAVTGVAGAGWVRLSLRPLQRVTATASQVAELPLASGEVAMRERVPDTDPRTEVGQVGSAFNRMLGHVADALAQRHASEERLRRFAADASHELRTPVAAIRGHAELALRHPRPVPEEVGHALTRIQAESARMGEMVDDLLLLARLDAGRPLAREPVDLTRLALDATSDARVAGPGHRWVLELSEEPVVLTGDGHRLHQVITNLLTNARTHSPAGTTVTVGVRPAGDSAEISVVDDGPGVPEAVRSQVFERFVRADHGRSRADGGTGLGLAIVHAVVLAHHGHVELDSRPGRTAVKVVLPYRAPAAPGPPAPQ